MSLKKMIHSFNKEKTNQYIIIIHTNSYKFIPIQRNGGTINSY